MKETKVYVDELPVNCDKCKYYTQFDNGMGCMITQENNRTNNRHIYYNGNEYTLFDLSEISKVGYKTLHQRLYMYGWDIDKAVNTPSRIKNKNTLKNQKRIK